MPKIPVGLRLDPDLIAAIDADRGDVPRVRWIERACEARLGRRALDAALREPGEGQPVESGPAEASGSIPHLSSSAPRRASGERARPAAAAGGGADQPPPGLGHASSAQVKRGVKPIPKAKR
jgi:hypothetical protein